MARKGMMGGNIKAVLILAVAAYTGYKGISYISNNMFQTVSPAEAAVQHALKSPVTIFSKTYCGFSKKAKMILNKYLQSYNIVELDTHPLGPEIQDLMLSITGARTVPRVFIDGAFIGGADDLEILDQRGELVPLLKKKGIAVREQ